MPRCLYQSSKKYVYIIMKGNEYHWETDSIIFAFIFYLFCLYFQLGVTITISLESEPLGTGKCSGVYVWGVGGGGAINGVFDNLRMFFFFYHVHLCCGSLSELHII